MSRIAVQLSHFSVTHNTLNYGTLTHSLWKSQSFSPEFITFLIQGKLFDIELPLPQQNKNPIIIAFEHNSAKRRDWNSHTEEQKRKKQINWALCVSLKQLLCPIPSLCVSFWSLLCNGRCSLLKRIPFLSSKCGCFII